MTWYPTDTHPSRPSLLRRAVRKTSATVRWAILVVLSGLAVAAVTAAAVAAMVAIIQSGF